MKEMIWRCLAALFLASFTIFALPMGGLAQALPLKEGKKKVILGGALVVKHPDSPLSEFDRALFGAREPSALTDARSRLDRVLARAIHGVDAVCALSDDQKRKLELAGRGDIKQLLDRIEGLRQKFETARRDGADDDVVRAIQSEIFVVRLILRAGPFDEESRFARTLQKTLTVEQAATYARRRLLAARSANKITLSNAAKLQNVEKRRQDVSRMAWHPGGELVGMMPFGKPLDIYSAREFRLVRTIGEGRALVGFDFSPNADVLAIAENSTNAFLINLASGKEIRLETRNSQPSVEFSPDGTLLATGGYGTRATLWSVGAGKWLRDFDAGPEGGLTPVFSPDGTLLALGNRNAKTRLFDVATGKLRHELPWGMSHELKFDATGKRLAVVYVDGSLAVWNVESGELLNRVRTRADELYAVDWSPDGSLLVTAGRNADVTLWNADDLTIVNEIECPEWVISARFNPDGTRLIFAGGTAVASTERYIEFWAVP